jgi:hypothetical protein
MSFGIVAMFQSERPRYLPTADELPCSDDTPVDNELQDWYAEDNQRYPTPAEQIKQAQTQIDRERIRSNKLAAKLRLLGIDPDE